MGQQDLKVHELVDRMERGDIRLPEMQRQYVWRQSQVRDLLDSLYRGYPSGTILTWETDEAVATRDSAIEQNTDSRSFQLLLDGQQRLTSLSAVIRGEPVYVRDRKTPIDIFFNLEHPETLNVMEVNEEGNSDVDEISNDDVTDASSDELLQRFERMTFVVSNKKLAAQPHWVSVTEVFRESSDAPFLKAAGVNLMEDLRYDKYTSRLKQLRSIRDYLYRVHILERDKSYEEVTEIFVRVNSLGVKLRSSDLALAQITATWRGSLEIFQKFEKSCIDRGFDLGLGIHLKNLVSFATGQSKFLAVSSLSKEQIESGWKSARQGMDYALNFLSNNVQIDNLGLLSSPFIIISIANYGYQKDYHLTPEDEKLLRYWILAANAKGRYSRGSSVALLDQDLTAIQQGLGIRRLIQLLRTQAGRLDVLPEDLENRGIRSAYFKTMFLAFKAQGATDWRDQLIISLKHSGVQHKLQFHHIFPQALLNEAKLSKEKINDVCNLAFIGGHTNRKLSNKGPSDYLPSIIEKQGEDTLRKQCIPIDETLWKLEAYDEFLEQRRILVANRLNEFLDHEVVQEEMAK